MTSASVAPPRPQGSPWFRSAPFDLLLILAVPYFLWPLIMAGQQVWGADLLGVLILLTATGHYFATFVRTYGDLELFNRFRVRFLLTPVVLLVTSVGLFATGNQGPLLLVTSAWALWHWLAQAFGFARIYDIKVGSFRRWTTYLDKAVVIVGFLGAITLIPGSIVIFGEVALSAGLPLPTAEQFAPLQTLVIVAMVVTGVLYVANLGWTIAKGLPWSWQKQFMHVTTIGYYWFAYAYLPNVLVAYVLYELFHDIQYFAITWLTCRGRVQRSGVTSWLSLMFRPSWVAAIGFTVLMTSFGALDIFGRESWFAVGDGHQIWIAVILVFALLHYYYDGFIWKAREGSLGADLGLKGGLRDALVPGLRHAACWLFFFAPIPLLMAFGHGELSNRERLESLVALSPRDFARQAELGLELTQARELEAAMASYEIAVTENPDYSVAHTWYGAALDLHGDLAAAEVQYRAALACADYKTAHAEAHVNLGVLLLLQKDRAAADEHFAAGRALGGAPSPVHRMMGMAAAVSPEAADRRAAYYEAVLQLDSSIIEAHGQLADLQLASAQYAAAANHFEAVLARSPNMAPALIGLCAAQVELGEIVSARATLQRAIAVAPQDPRVLALRTRLGL